MPAITAAMVGELRAKTDAPMMECKKALTEADGDMTKAEEILRVKLGSKASKAASRVTAEGVIVSYIQGNIGALLEVNCETDFVARREEFKKLVNDVAMQIAACPNVEYVKVADIPAEISAKEKEIEMGRDDLANKPDNIKEKIVAGRIEKRLKELSLLDQPFIRDQNISIDELLKQAIAALGENIQVRRFQRFVLGEGIEKEETDFAAEVAAQMGQKAPEPVAAAPQVEEKAPEPAAKDNPPAKGKKKK